MTTPSNIAPEKTGTWINAGFVATLLMCVFLAIVASRSIISFLASHDNVEHAYSVQGGLHDLLSSLKDIQRGARGYVITADTLFLEPFKKGQQQILLQIASLRAAVGSNPKQLRRMETIVVLAENEMREMVKEIDFTRAGELDRAHETVRTGEGKRAMDAITNIVHQMVDEENARLADQSTQADTEFYVTIVVLVLGSFITLLVIVTIFLVLRRQFRERQRMADVLHRNELRLQTVINSIQEGLTFSNATGGFEIFNPQMRELTGYTMEDANRSGDFSRLIYPDPSDRQRALDGVRRLIEQKGTYVSEAIITTRTGEKRLLRTASRMLEQEQSRMFLTTYQDITQDRANHDAMRESERRYRLLFENNPIPLVIYDTASLGILKVNGAMEDAYGYARAELLAMTIKELHPEEDRGELLTYLTTYREARQRGDLWRHLKKDGSVIQVETRSHAIEWDGHDARLVLIHDITERLRTEREIKVQRAYFERLFETMPEGIALLDEGGRIRNVNRAYEQIFGFTKDEVLGRDVLAITVLDEHVEEVRNSLDAVLNGVPIHLETRRKRKDGSIVDVSIIAIPFNPAEGVRMAYVIYRDITQRKLSEKEREELIAQLQEALNEVKTLSGLLPICAWCKKVRDDSGYYHQIEHFIAQHSEATFTHGICPECLGRMQKEIDVHETGRKMKRRSEALGEQECRACSE